MGLFNIDNQGHLTGIKEQPFRLEKDIQTLTENNLTTIFGLHFIKTEFSLKNFRIDTFAFDRDAKAFVIIEYKKDKNFSVIDQGYAYLSLMLNNKADFILEYNESSANRLKRDDIDWSQSKVVFVSPSFTTYQREAINFKDLPIELWEVKRYNNKTVIYTQIHTTGAQESVKTISSKDESVKKVSREIKVFTEQDHIEYALDETKELYYKFKSAILNLDGIEIKPKKYYIAFISGSNVVDINIKKKCLKIWINMRAGDLDDPKGLSRDVSNIGHWGNGDYELQVKDDDNIEYIISLVKQSLKKNKK